MPSSTALSTRTPGPFPAWAFITFSSAPVKVVSSRWLMELPLCQGFGVYSGTRPP